MSATRILKTLVQFNTPGPARVVEPSMVLSQVVYASEVLVLQLTFQSCKVLGDAICVAAFWDYACATAHAPYQRYLCRRTVTFGGYVDYRLIFEQLWSFSGVVCRVGAGEWRVTSDVDAVLLVPGDPVSLWQVRVQLHLVYCWWMARVVEEI